jgi:ABC-type phosphate transport system substrate-binding protein
MTRILVVLGLLAAAVPIEAAEMLQRLVVVTSPGNPHDQLSLETIRLIFKRRLEIDAEGNHWVPVNLPAQDPIRQAFSEAVFTQLPQDMDDYWNQQYFLGITPPQVLASEEAVIRFIEATPGSIGYINWASADHRVKVVHTLLVQPH